MTERITSDDIARDILSPCQECLNSLGCDLHWRMEKWRDLAGAKNIKAQFSKDDDKFYYSKELDDNTTQARAMENMCKLAGDYPAEKHAHEIDGGPVILKVVYEDKLEAKKGGAG